MLDVKFVTEHGTHTHGTHTDSLRYYLGLTVITYRNRYKLEIMRIRTSPPPPDPTTVQLGDEIPSICEIYTSLQKSHALHP